MTTEGEKGNETLDGFKPRGTIALAVAYVALMMLLWFSLYIILLSRGATT